METEPAETLDRELEDYGATFEFGGYLMQATVQFGTAALRAAMLLNGAAAIALLALVEKIPSPQFVTYFFTIAPFECALFCFALGALLAGLGAAFAYSGCASTTGHWFIGQAERRRTDLERDNVDEDPKLKKLIRRMKRSLFFAKWAVRLAFVLFGAGIFFAYLAIF